MTNNKIAIYPGTFDPITVGHMDIIRRALAIVDHLIIGIAKDTSKNPLFSLDERKKMVEAEIAHLNKDGKTVQAMAFEGLLINFAKENNSNIIIRGLRAVSDFEYEFQMSGMNSKLDQNIQTIFLPASESTHFIASKLVKEVARLDGDITEFVSPNVKKLLEKKFK